MPWELKNSGIVGESSSSSPALLFFLDDAPEPVGTDCAVFCGGSILPAPLPVAGE